MSDFMKDIREKKSPGQLLLETENSKSKKFSQGKEPLIIKQGKERKSSFAALGKIYSKSLFMKEEIGKSPFPINKVTISFIFQKLAAEGKHLYFRDEGNI